MGLRPEDDDAEGSDCMLGFDFIPDRVRSGGNSDFLLNNRGSMPSFVLIGERERLASGCGEIGVGWSRGELGALFRPVARRIRLVTESLFRLLSFGGSAERLVRLVEGEP